MRAERAVTAQWRRRNSERARAIHPEISAITADPAFFEDLGKKISIVGLLLLAGDRAFHVVRDHAVRSAPVSLLQPQFFSSPVELGVRHWSAHDPDQVSDTELFERCGELALAVLGSVVVITQRRRKLETLSVPFRFEFLVEHER